MYDAFNVFVTGFRDLAQNEEPKVTPLSCSGMDVSEHGESLGKVIKKVGTFHVLFETTIGNYYHFSHLNIVDQFYLDFSRAQSISMHMDKELTLIYRSWK